MEELLQPIEPGTPLGDGEMDGDIDKVQTSTPSQ